MSLILFIALAVLTLGGGLGVVATRNVVHASLALLLSLLAVAGIYLILFAEFLAIVQVLIYGGAITIVLLFAIMLTRTAEYPRITDNRQWPLAAAAAVATLAVLGDHSGLMPLSVPSLTARLSPIWPIRCSPDGPYLLRWRRWYCWWRLSARLSSLGKARKGTNWSI